MGKLFNKVLNFVNWETEEEEETAEENEFTNEEPAQPQFIQSSLSKKAQSKVVNIHSSNHLKVVIMQPTSFDESQEICDHLKNKKPIVVNLEGVEKSDAQRIIDFLSGAAYALDGHIQKVSAGIFVIAPNNVDLMGDFKDELKSKGVFPWMK